MYIHFVQHLSDSDSHAYRILILISFQVVKKVKIRVESDEDRWALKLLNFITGVNQLLFDGLTRELPL